MASGLRAGSDQGEGQWPMAGMVTELGPHLPKPSRDGPRASEGRGPGIRPQCGDRSPVVAPRGELGTGLGLEEPQACSGEPSWMPQT